MSDEGAWVAYVVDDEGGRRYLRSATRETSGKDFTRNKGGAARFATEREAQAAAKELKQDYENRENYRGWIVRVETKRVTGAREHAEPRPPRAGRGGRAVGVE